MKIAFSRRPALGLILFVVLSLVGSLLSAPSAGQSLATAAKKEKQRRAKIAAPGKVLTEEDAAARTGNVNVTELAAPAPEAADTPSSQSSTPDGQATWKARAAELKTALASAQKALEDAQRAEAAFRSDVAPLSAADAQDPMRRQKREARLAEMNKQIEVLRAAVASARASITALEDEARRAGVPSGWLR